MSENTKIEWCDATLNAWWGCTKASDGCKFCYALDLDNRYHPGESAWVPDDPACALPGATVPNGVAVEYPFAEWDGDPETGEGDWFGDMTPMLKIGKKAAGRVLDGREWSEFPKVAS